MGRAPLPGAWPARPGLPRALSPRGFNLRTGRSGAAPAGATPCGQAAHFQRHPPARPPPRNTRALKSLGLALPSAEPAPAPPRAPPRAPSLQELPLPPCPPPPPTPQAMGPAPPSPPAAPFLFLSPLGTAPHPTPRALGPPSPTEEPVS